jgi:hypothetical protein
MQDKVGKIVLYIIIFSVLENRIKIGRIWVFHSRDYEEYYLVGYNAV